MTATNLPVEQALREHDNEYLDTVRARRFRKMLDTDQGLSDYYEAILDATEIIREANDECAR